MKEEKILEMLKVLQCPISKGELSYNKEKSMIYSKEAKVFFPIKGDILVLLEDEAIAESDIV